MIKMSYEQLTQTKFRECIIKLSNAPMKTPQAFRIKHIIQALQKEQNGMKDNFQKEVVALYATDGVAGEVKTPEAMMKGLPFEPMEGKIEDAEKAMAAFGKREFTINQNKISSDLLFSVGEWSPSELIALEPLVAELSLVEEEVPVSPAQ